jgi:hypothetical protein
LSALVEYEGVVVALEVAEEHPLLQEFLPEVVQGHLLVQLVQLDLMLY